VAGLGSMMDKLPMMGKINPIAMENASPGRRSSSRVMEAIINSMTPPGNGVTRTFIKRFAQAVGIARRFGSQIQYWPSIKQA